MEWTYREDQDRWRHECANGNIAFLYNRGTDEIKCTCGETK